MFWTMPLHESTMSVGRGSGTARYRVKDLAIPDYGTHANSFANGPNSPGVVSFDLRWFGAGERRTYIHPGDPTEPDSYALGYRDTEATLEWDARSADGSFSFTSYPADLPGRESSKIFAIVGEERNGRFFAS